MDSLSALRAHIAAFSGVTLAKGGAGSGWRNPLHGGTHVKRAPTTGEDGDGTASLHGQSDTVVFHPDKAEADAYRVDVTRWFGLPAIARNRGLPLSLGKPPAVLRMLGVGPEPLQIDRGTLIKVSRPHGDDPKGHGITLEQMKSLPEQIADPVAVFKSNTSGGIIVLTDMKDVNGEYVIVAVHIGKQSGRRTVNDIASVHGRPDADFSRWMSSGSLLYFNPKKNPASPMGLSLQLLRRDPSWRGSSTIVGPDDVVKFHELNKSMPVLLVTFAAADKHTILKSHIAAYVRKACQS